MSTLHVQNAPNLNMYGWKRDFRRLARVCSILKKIAKKGNESRSRFFACLFKQNCIFYYLYYHLYDNINIEHSDIILVMFGSTEATIWSLSCAFVLIYNHRKIPIKWENEKFLSPKRNRRKEIFNARTAGH